jgi:hypothetical protein
MSIFGFFSSTAEIQLTFPGVYLDRLHTIMDYDLVLVMDRGQAVELGSPAELLSNANGTFSELVNATGPESAQALRAMAQGELTNHSS